jgi:dihydrofolate reductase
MSTTHLISAIAIDGTIGINNKIPWKISEDLQYYKAKTLDSVVIVGYNTYLSLPKVALRNRVYIVVTKKKINDIFEDDYSVHFICDPKMALHFARQKYKHLNIYIAGGGQIYEQLIGECEFAHITWVSEKYEGKNKIKFPNIKLFTIFKEFSSSDWNVNPEGLEFKFVTYARK